MGGGGDFLFSVLAVSIVAYPDAAAPIMREDNVRLAAAAAAAKYFYFLWFC